MIFDSEREMIDENKRGKYNIDHFIRTSALFSLSLSSSLHFIHFIIAMNVCVDRSFNFSFTVDDEIRFLPGNTQNHKHEQSQTDCALSVEYNQI